MASLVIAVAGCGAQAGGGSSAGSSGQAVPSSHVVTIVSNPGISALNAAMYAAQTTGALGKVEQAFGVQIKFTYIEGTSAPLIAALIGGSADAIAGTAANQILQANQNGLDLQGVFALYQSVPLIWVGQEKYKDSRGNDFTKYNGGIWAYSAAGSTADIYSQGVADAVGLDWTKQHGLAVGDQSATLGALKANRTDIATMFPAGAAQAVATGAGYIMMNGLDTSSVEAALGVKGRQIETLGGELVMTKHFTSKYPALTEALVGAMASGLKSVQAVMDDPVKSFALFPPDIQQQIKPNFASAWALCVPAFKGIAGGYSPDLLKATAALYVKYKAISPDEGSRISDVFTNQFVHTDH